MDKVDLKKTLPSCRAKHSVFDTIEVPPLQYLMIDGHGDPNSSTDFTSAVETLFPLAYALKFFSKDVLGRDYVVPPLEGLWWAEDMSSFTSARDKSHWSFTLMLLVPDRLGGSAVEHAAAGLTMTGRHHEIYLSDLRRTAPEKLRTILRQPLQR